MSAINYPGLVNIDEMVDNSNSIGESSHHFAKMQSNDNLNRNQNTGEMSFKSPKHQVYQHENVPSSLSAMAGQQSQLQLAQQSGHQYSDKNQIRNDGMYSTSSVGFGNIVDQPPNARSVIRNPMEKHAQSGSQAHIESFAENLPLNSSEYEQILMQQHSLSIPMSVGSAANLNSTMLRHEANIHGSEQKLSAMYNAQQHSDYIISDYMDKISTRINILETELKFAWRALDLLSGEYSKMWGRLEKLENITLEQQSVVSNLMGLYGASGSEMEKDVADLILQQQMHYGKILQHQQAMQDMQRQLQDHQTYEVMEHDQNELQKAPPSAIEFHDMLEDLKNDALDRSHCGNFGAPNVHSRNPFETGNTDDVPLNKRPFTEPMSSNTNIPKQYPNDVQKEQLLSNMQFENMNEIHKYTAEQLANVASASSSSFRDFLTSSNIKEGLEEGIDLIQREALKQKYIKNSDGIFRSNIISDAAKNSQSDVDFFRSGELNRDLYSNKMPAHNASGAHEHVHFFRLNSDRVGVGTAALPNDEEICEQLYRNLYSAQSNSNNPYITEPVLFGGQIGSSMADMILPHEDVVDHMIASRPVSSLDMIYEDNEEQDPTEADNGKNDGRSDMHKMANDEKKGFEKALPMRRSKKKKQHKQHEMEALNNLKSTITKTASIDNEIDRNDATSSNETITKKAVAPESISVENLTKDELIALIIAEVGKIEDLSLFTSDQMNGLKQLVTKEISFFENLKNINSNLLLLLLNPISSTDDSYESTQQKYEELKQKLHKNIEIIKKLFGNKENVPIDFITDIKPNDLDIDEILETSSKIGDDYDDRTYSSSSRFASNHDINTPLDSDLYSQNLIQDNTNLNEQLKALESKENEIICKRSMNKLNSNENLSAEYYQQQQYIDTYGYQQGGAVYNKHDFPQYSSNSSIYSNDEYIKSLKKSLERHNSMLFLLHLQNANSRSGDDNASNNGDLHEAARKQKDSIQMIDDDIISSCSQSPPPPAPNGEDTVDSTADCTVATVMMPTYGQVYNMSMSTMNPFHSDLEMMNAEFNQQSSQSQYAMQTAKDFGHTTHNIQSNICTILESSPKKTKSDSGLSSMSGFSSLEKSPNSPNHKPRIVQYHMASQPNFCGSKNELQINTDKGDFMFSEENLNYIRELSKNVPICSAFENKSMFAAQPVPLQGHHRSQQPQILLHSSQVDSQSNQKSCSHESNVVTHKENKADVYSQHQQMYINAHNGKLDQHRHATNQLTNYPDLVQDQQLFMTAPSQNSQLPYAQSTGRDMSNTPATMAQHAQKSDDTSSASSQSNHKQNSQQKHKNLTDRLVYYPSSNTITDYISSMNLDYLGYNKENEHQSQQMPHAHQPGNAAYQQHQQQLHYNSHNSARHDSGSDGFNKDARAYGRGPHGRNIYYSQDGGHEMEHQQQHAQYYKYSDGRKYMDDPNGERSQPGSSASPSHATGTSKYLNKFSHWLPELKLKKISKRHRSHSLPIGIENDDNVQFSNEPYNARTVQIASSSPSSSSWQAQKAIATKSTSRTGSKKKKRNIVSTMSNIMQKAKIYRRHSFTHSSSANQPGSTPSTASTTPIKSSIGTRHESLRETSSSWHMGKRPEQSSSASETENDLYGGFYSDNEDTNAGERYDRTNNDEFRQHSSNIFSLVGTKANNNASNADVDVSAGMDKERVNSQFQKYVTNIDNKSNLNGNDQPQPNTYNDHSNNSHMKFQTMGDVKIAPNKEVNQNNRASSGNESGGSDEINNSASGTTEKITPNNSSDTANKFIFSSTSMEFAVSRKIAKYRQKNVSSDDINGQRSVDLNSSGFGEEENNNGAVYSGISTDSNSMENKNDSQTQQKLSGHHLQKTHSIFVEDEMFGTSEYEYRDGQELNAFGGAHNTQSANQQPNAKQFASQPYCQSVRKHGGMQMPPQQQSLDIPTRDDEDNKSQHSYRTISSSRRQSTEDSIDTDDEYFCYELRKLEELERISHMEKEAGNNNDLNKRVYHEQKLLSKIDRLANVDGDGPITKYEEEDEEDMMIMYYNSEADTYQPDDDVREKMSIVLQELKSVVQSKPELVRDASASKPPNYNNVKKHGNAYEKFTHVTDISRGQPQPIAQRKTINTVQQDYYGGDDDCNNFMREINQFEFEINHERGRKQSNPFVKIDKSVLGAFAKDTIDTKKVTRKKRKKKSPGDANMIDEHYDSEENRFSPSPQTSADEEWNEDRDKSHSSGATSGPDSPCHFTDDDIDGHAATLCGISGVDNYKDYSDNIEQSLNMLDVNEKQNFVKSTIITEENEENRTNIPNEEFVRGSGDGGFIGNDEQLNEIEDGDGVFSPVQNESIDSADAAVGVAFTKSKKLGRMLSHESSQDSNNGALGSSKWKLLKTLKEKKIEEKNNQEKIKEEEIANKKKDAVSKIRYTLYLTFFLF